MIDAVALTQQLVRIDTRNPPGNEAACADVLEALLGDAGIFTPATLARIDTLLPIAALIFTFEGISQLPATVSGR